jgi:methylthioribose-1-phosphate isomerase
MNEDSLQRTNPVKWLGSKIEILDQSLLPWEEKYLQLGTYQEVAQAIKEMRVRGAPIIGICAAYGLALAGQAIKEEDDKLFLTKLRGAAESLTSTRPTAVNLFRAVQRMLEAAGKETEVTEMRSALVAEARRIHTEEAEATERISHLGAELIVDGSTVLTHCNAGSLATGGYGTALGVIKAASKQGKQVQVMATETRPLLQGARLTAWELMREGIPVTLITDSMAGYFMSARKVGCVVVGADRVAANGDTANKIGTYALAVLAKENGIPFYVAAPTTTIDLSIPSGNEIPIEFRSPEEITCIRGVSIAPENVKAMNPAFDVTPHRLVSAIVTERGILREPYKAEMDRIFGDGREGGAVG